MINNWTKGTVYVSELIYSSLNDGLINIKADNGSFSSLYCGAVMTTGPLKQCQCYP